MMTDLNGKWVFDSNILVYFLDNKSSFHKKTKDLFSLILSKQIEGVLTQQNVIETERVLFLAYKLKRNKILNTIDNLIESFNFQLISPLYSTLEKYHTLLKSIKTHNDIFDIYLSATIIDNGFNRILTNNTKDFYSVKGIEAVNPFL